MTADHKPLEAEREAEIRATLASAYSPPWRYLPDNEGSSMGWVGHQPGGEPFHELFAVCGDSAQQADNAELAAAAPQAIADLLSAHDYWRAEADRLRAANVSEYERGVRESAATATARIAEMRKEADRLDRKQRWAEASLLRHEANGRVLASTEILSLLPPPEAKRDG